MCASIVLKEIPGKTRFNSCIVGYLNQSDTDRKRVKTRIRIQIALLYETLQGEWCRAAIPKISAPKKSTHNS